MAKKKVKDVERDQFGRRLHADKPTKNGHYMGKECGFTFEDGAYIPAPQYLDTMVDLVNARHGLAAFIAAQNVYLGEQYKIIAARENQWWKRVLDDYELDPSVKWEYYDGSIRRVKEKPEDGK